MALQAGRAPAVIFAAQGIDNNHSCDSRSPCCIPKHLTQKSLGPAKKLRARSQNLWSPGLERKSGSLLRVRVPPADPPVSDREGKAGRGCCCPVRHCDKVKSELVQRHTLSTEGGLQIPNPSLRNKLRAGFAVHREMA